MPYLPDVYAELAEVDAFINRSARADARATQLGRGGAARVNDLAARFPHLSPDAVMALGRSGVDPQGPFANAVALIGAGLMLRDHPGGRRYGAPSVTPGQRREMTARQHDQQVQSWHPQSGNPDAKAAWREAQDAGFVQEGILTIPLDRDTRDDFDRLLVRLTAAGEEVPVMSPQAGSDTWKAYITRRGADAPTAAEEQHLTNTELRQRRATQIDWTELSDEQEARAAAGSRYGAGAAAGIAGSVPGSAAFRAAPGPQAAATRASVSGALREAVQGAFIALDAPVQEVQGQVRNLYGATHGRGDRAGIVGLGGVATAFGSLQGTQSDLGIMLTTGIDDAGQGFFVDPESAVAQERRRREAERGQIGGHNVTLGRWVADAAPFATDSKPSLVLSGLVDLGVQIADPSGYVLGKAGEIGETRRLFQATDLAAEEGAGVIRGLRNLLNGPEVATFLDSSAGVDRLRWIAGVTSPYEIWRGMNRKITFDLATRLADTHTPEAARAVLEPELGRSIREVATVDMPALGRTPRAGAPNQMPIRGPIDAWDKDIVGHELEAWLHNARASDESIRTNLDRVARSDSPGQLNGAIRQALRDTDGELARQGINEKLRSRLVQLHENANAEASAAYRYSMASQTPTSNAVTVGGEVLDMPPARLFVEHAPQHITLPDARNIRRVTSRYSALLARGDTGELRIPFYAAEWLQNEIWKPVQLVTRIAWPIRVIAEEQVRMAAAGYDSVFRHPLSLIATRVGRKNATDFFENPIEEANQLKAVLTRGNGDWVSRRLSSGHETIYARTNPHTRDDYIHAWASEIARVAGDPVAGEMQRAESLDAAKAWFNQGGGLKYKADMAVMNPGKFDTVEQADAYLEQTVLGRLQNAHGGDTTLSDVIRTGRFDGRQIVDGNRIDKGFVDYLDTVADDFGPDRVIGEIPMSRMGRRGAQWDSAVDHMFGWLMTGRTNNLSRVPTFKQEYWREGERLIPHLSPEAKAQMLDAARAANVDGWRIGNRAIKRMERTAARGDLTLEEADLIAKGQALEATKELLYDLTRKGRLADAWRIVFPFGEAWSEVMTRWLGPRGLIAKNPKTVRRFQQLIQGARGEQFGELMGAPEGEGFFWNNEFGEEVFIYPGSQLLTEHALGVPVPLTGRVQGLSMFGTVMPGLGPVAQIPVGWFLSNKPGPQQFKDVLSSLEDVKVGPLGTVKEQILPFGATGAEDQGDVLSAYNYVPPWIKAAFDFMSTGDGNEASWASAVMDTASYLRSTGRYDDSVAGQQQLLEDAQFEARNLYLIKAIAGVAAPASPQIETMVENDQGDLIRLAALSAEYRKMIEDHGIQAAGRQFLDKYGTDLHAVVATAQTTTSRTGTPMTHEGVQWVLAHPGIEDDLPSTYGLFAPVGGQTDLSIYRAELRTGARVRYDPKTWIRLLSNTTGDMLYSQARDQIDGTPNRAESEWLRDIADGIRAEHPGWGDTSGKLENASTETMVAELQRAVNHPAVRGTDAGEGLRLYLAARRQAQRAADEEGVASFDTARSMEPTREWLNDIAAQIIDEHPAFEAMWTFVFSREARVEE